MHFPGGVYRTDMFFQGVSICSSETLLSHRTDANFPKNPYLVKDIVRIYQEPLFSLRSIY